MLSTSHQCNVNITKGQYTRSTDKTVNVGDVILVFSR